MRAKFANRRSSSSISIPTPDGMLGHHSITPRITFAGTHVQVDLHTGSHQAGPYPGFSSMKRLSTPSWMKCQSIARLPLALNLLEPIYTLAWEERSTVRGRTRTARSATASPHYLFNTNLKTFSNNI